MNRETRKQKPLPTDLGATASPPSASTTGVSARPSAEAGHRTTAFAFSHRTNAPDQDDASGSAEEHSADVVAQTTDHEDEKKPRHEDDPSGEEDDRSGESEVDSADELVEEHTEHDEGPSFLAASEKEKARLAATIEKRGPSSGAPRASTSAAMPKSTIRYARGLAEAGAAVGLTADQLASRKPHKKTGTGSSGTDHKIADGNAAKLALGRVEAKIEEKTGVKMKPAQYLKTKEKASKTEAARSEKQAAVAEKKLAEIDRTNKDYKDWIAYLAPDSWRQQQETLGNSVRSKPSDKRGKALEAKAKTSGWPMSWKNSLAKDIYDE